MFCAMRLSLKNIVSNFSVCQVILMKKRCGLRHVGLEKLEKAKNKQMPFIEIKRQLYVAQFVILLKFFHA